MKKGILILIIMFLIILGGFLIITYLIKNQNAPLNPTYLLQNTLNQNSNSEDPYLNPMYSLQNQANINSNENQNSDPYLNPTYSIQN